MLPVRFTILSCFVASFLLSCGAARHKADDTPRGAVRFECDVEEALLEVDGQRMGPIGLFRDQGVLLGVGQHRIIVRHAGYFDVYMMIEVTENELHIVKVPLRAIPD